MSWRCTRVLSPRTTRRRQIVSHAEVESVDKSIDGLVYELYGLSEEEIKIVEGK